MARMVSISLIAVLMTFVATACGNEQRGFTRLIPAFDRESEKPTTASTVKRTSFQKMMDATKPSRLIPNRTGPSLLKKMNSQTKRLAGKTKAAIIKPWKVLAKHAKPNPPDRRHRSQKKPAKKSWFAGLFTKPAKPKPAPTLNDFLGRERP